MCTPDLITWIRKAGYVYTCLHHMDQEGWLCVHLASSHGQEGYLCVHLASSHGSGSMHMYTPDFITWIRKAAYVYT